MNKQRTLLTSKLNWLSLLPLLLKSSQLLQLILPGLLDKWEILQKSIKSLLLLLFQLPLKIRRRKRRKKKKTSYLQLKKMTRILTWVCNKSLVRLPKMKSQLRKRKKKPQRRKSRKSNRPLSISKAQFTSLETMVKNWQLSSKELPSLLVLCKAARKSIIRKKLKSRLLLPLIQNLAFHRLTQKLLLLLLMRNRTFILRWDLKQPSQGSLRNKPNCSRSKSWSQ